MTFAKERLGGVCDGVAAIVATLLVIELKVPFNEGEALGLADFREQAHLLVAWVISFTMVGVIWYEQHLSFAHASRMDTAFIVAALAQLAALSLVPFGSSLVGLYPTDIEAALAFTVVMFVNGMIVALQSFMIARRTHLQRSPAARAMAVRGRLQVAVYTGVALLSALVAVLHVPLSGVLAWLASPILLGLRPAARPDAAEHQPVAAARNPS